MCYVSCSVDTFLLKNVFGKTDFFELFFECFNFQGKDFTPTIASKLCVKISFCVLLTPLSFIAFLYQFWKKKISS